MPSEAELRYMRNAARNPGESFKDYRERIRRNAAALKQELKGYIAWPAHHGTLRKYKDRKVERKLRNE